VSDDEDADEEEAAMDDDKSKKMPENFNKMPNVPSTSTKKSDYNTLDILLLLYRA